MKKKLNKGIFILIFTLLIGCMGIPDNVTPINNFEPVRYLGKWYEIARLNHSFEKGLEKVTADYSLMTDGGIKVVNRGFDPVKNKWKVAVGKAYFVLNPEIGRLKVSFFGPFYGAYNIIEIDRNNYFWAVVCGPNKSYLWILAREPKLNRAVMDELLLKIKAYGFKTDELIYVPH